jgi:hypothetical protein
MPKRSAVATHDPLVSLVPLTQGKFAIVDASYADLVCQYSWYFDHGYAASRVYGKKTYMHKLIGQSLGFDESLQVDHANRNRLDNRVANLRPANAAQQAANSTRNGRLGLRGVSIGNATGEKPYKARIRFDGKQINLGYFATPELAAYAYDAAAIKAFGPFALTNYPVSDLTRAAIKTLLECAALLMEKGRSYGNSLDGDGKAIERIDNRIREKLDRSKVSGLTGDTAMDAIGLIALRTAVAK